MTYWWKFGRKSVIKGTNETGHQHIERTMWLFNLTEGLRLTKGSIGLSADTESNDQREAETVQIIMSIFAFLL